MDVEPREKLAPSLVSAYPPQQQQGPPPPPYSNPQQPAYYPGQPAPGPPYQPAPGVPYQQHGQQSVVVVSQPGVVRVGSCPFCGIGVARENYTLIGILIAFLFFPLGIICCLMMTERRCTHCRAAI